MELANSDLYKVSREDISASSKCLTDAFLDDPVNKWLIPNREQRKKFLTRYYKTRTRYGLKYGKVYATSNNFEGIIIWLPAHNLELSLFKILKAGGLKLLNVLSFDLLSKLRSMNKFMSHFRERLIKKPYWELGPVAVQPEYQGQGLASRLIRPFLTWLEQKKVNCYLETQSQKNVRIYENYGFEIAAAGKLPETSINHWGMIFSSS